MRAIVSVGPPGANGTIAVMGRFGYGCAVALPIAFNPTASAVSISVRFRLVIMVRSCVGVCEVHSKTQGSGRDHKRIILLFDRTIKFIHGSKPWSGTRSALAVT